MLSNMAKVTVDFSKDFEIEYLVLPRWALTIITSALKEKGRGRFDYRGEDMTEAQI